MSEAQSTNVTIQFWVLAALYASECHWFAWASRNDSPRARNRRYANAARAKAMVVYDRILNQEITRARLLEDRND